MTANRFLGQILAQLNGLRAVFSGKRKSTRPAAHRMAFAGGLASLPDRAHAPGVAPPPVRPVKPIANAASVEKPAARVATPARQDPPALPAALPLPVPLPQAHRDPAPVRPVPEPVPAPVLAPIPVVTPIAVMTPVAVTAPAAATAAPVSAPAMRSLEEVRADLARLRASAQERHAQLKAQHESAFAPTDFLDFSVPAPAASETAYASTAFFDFKVLEPTPSR